jgi:hypothetical protein
MSGAVISQVRLGAAHDGVAELVVTLRYDNGGETLVALDRHAADHLYAACGVSRSEAAAEAFIGQGWECVRDALAASSNRFAAPAQ